jgi:DNA-binding response OmpR family regulator
VHLSRLRHKLAAAGGPRVGTAVRGVGYRLGIDRLAA